MDKEKRELIKQHLEREAKAKGNSFVIDLENETVHVLDDDIKWRCYICLNHTDIIDEHHKDHDHDNNDPSNISRICRFCHENGIHGQSFYTHPWYETMVELKPFVTKGKNKDQIKFVFKPNTSEYVDFMANVSEHGRAIEGLRYLIGIWLIEYRLENPNQYLRNDKSHHIMKGNKLKAQDQARRK